MEKHEGSNILVLESGAHSCLFLPFKVDLAFGKILNIWEEPQ